MAGTTVLSMPEPEEILELGLCGGTLEATGWICGKRLAPFLPELGPALEHEQSVRLTVEDRTALLQLSAVTSGRRLARTAARDRLEDRCT